MPHTSDWQVFGSPAAGKTGTVSLYAQGHARLLEKYSDKTERLPSPAVLTLYCAASSPALSVSIMPPVEAILDKQLDHTATYKLDDGSFRNLSLVSPATVRIHLANRLNLPEGLPLPFKVMFPNHGTTLAVDLLNSKKLVVRMRTMTGDILEMDFPTQGLLPVAKESRRLCSW